MQSQREGSCDALGRGTRRTGNNPRLNQLAKQLLRSRHGISTRAGVPAIGDDIVLSHTALRSVRTRRATHHCLPHQEQTEPQSRLSGRIFARTSRRQAAPLGWGSPSIVAVESATAFEPAGTSDRINLSIFGVFECAATQRVVGIWHQRRLVISAMDHLG